MYSLAAKESIIDPANLSNTSKASTPTGRLLIELFRQLEENTIGYGVLRNYKGLPDDIGHDVDLMVEKKGVDDFGRVLVEVSESLGWSVIKVSKRFSFVQYYMIRKSDLSFDILKIDAWLPIHWKGITTASEHSIIQTKKKFRGFWIASSGSEAAVSLFKEYLQFGKVKDKGRGETKRRISALAQEDPENFIATVESYLGKELSQFALKCAQTAHWERLEKDGGKIRRHLVKQALRQRPFGQLRDWVRFLWGHFSNKVLYSSGLFICLIGPDGSGKTTISHAIEEDMKDIFNRVRYFHGRITIFPRLRSLVALFRKRHEREDIKSFKTESASTESKAPPLFLILYYSLEHFLYHFIIRWFKGQGDLILFDRYFYDYLIQKYFRKVPRWLIEWIQRLLPKPDILIFLKNVPEVIFERKPELTKDEIRDQIHVCDEIVRGHKGAVSVWTNDNPDITAAQVRKKIFTFLEQRTKSRLRKS